MISTRLKRSESMAMATLAKSSSSLEDPSPGRHKDSIGT
jgi:hypothetical protein